MDPTGLIGKAPETSDPVTWIALLLVVVLAAIVIWQLKSSAMERKETREEFQVAMRAIVEDFRTELAEDRRVHAAQVQQAHDRISSLTEEVRRFATASR